ncbi:hypothetical protein OHB12_32095 [Nocardia sp. NBC_01730]|uniref:hypothetical protein n=1 Tax=Nocardia sp. NBC_01730 TaxID=2975998 RepID=UPI002E13EF09|nr:hypothetical protein OHB12_32095 [Nocardia sp. NBC_01730]
MTGITPPQRRTQTWLVRPLIVSAIAATPETPTPTEALAEPDATVAASSPERPGRHGNDRPGFALHNDRDRDDRHRTATATTTATAAARTPSPPHSSAAAPTTDARRVDRSASGTADHSSNPNGDLR